MSALSRLSLALDSGDVTLPEAGRVAVFAPRAGMDLSALPADLCHVITTFKPDRDHFAGQGFTCGKEPDGRYAASLVCLPRAKALGQALVAEAASVTDGPVIVDGAKTDGVESILKACRKRAEVSPALSKAHGKLFHFPASTAFADSVGPSTEGGIHISPESSSLSCISPPLGIVSVFRSAASSSASATG